MNSRMTSRGRVTIPKQLRDHLGWEPGDELHFLQEDDGVKIVRSPRRLDGAVVLERLRRVRWNPTLTTDRLISITRGEQ